MDHLGQLAIGVKEGLPVHQVSLDPGVGLENLVLQVFKVPLEHLEGEDGKEEKDTEDYWA